MIYQLGKKKSKAWFPSSPCSNSVCRCCWPSRLNHCFLALETQQVPCSSIYLTTVSSFPSCSDISHNLRLCSPPFLLSLYTHSLVSASPPAFVYISLQTTPEPRAPALTSHLQSVLSLGTRSTWATNFSSNSTFPKLNLFSSLL